MNEREARRKRESSPWDNAESIEISFYPCTVFLFFLFFDNGQEPRGRIADQLTPRWIQAAEVWMRQMTRWRANRG